MPEHRCAGSAFPDIVPWRRKPAFAACLVFLVLECALILGASKDWDVVLFHQYASLYRGSSLEGLYTRATVEYPCGAVLLFLTTDAIAQRLPDCSALGGVFPEYRHPSSFANFKLVYRLAVALFTFVAFLVLLEMVGHCREGFGERCERLLTFAIGLFLLGHNAFGQLDMILADMLLFAVALLVSTRSCFWSFAVLAAAVGVKIVPLALAPLWVVGSLPVALLTARQPGSWPRILRSVSGRGLLLAGLLITCFLPFLLFGGPRSLAFFGYHRDRGIEYASTYAALLDVLSYFGRLKTITYSSYGSWDVASPLSPWLVSLAPLLGAVLFLGATLGFLAAARRAAAAQPELSGSNASLACALRSEFVASTLLVLFLFLLTNKVFSPQYVLWLLPLVAMAPMVGWPRRLFQVGFLGLCYLTALSFRWMTEIIGERSPLDPHIFQGSSAFGTALLVTRTALLAALIVALIAYLARRQTADRSLSHPTTTVLN